MAEVLGIVSSVIAVLQLTGALVSLGYDYIGAVKDAQNDIQQLVSELLSLSNVLLTLQKNIRSMGNKPHQLAALQTLNRQDGPLPGCMLELKSLQTKLVLNQKKGLEGKIRRLIWPLKEKETLGHLNRLERHRALFSLALAADQLTLLKEIDEYIQGISLTVHELKSESSVQNAWMEKKDDDYTVKKRDTIINWISREDFDTKHLEISGRRQGGTGQWLLGTLEFQNWIKGHPDFLLLWGHGIPGAGKTFLSSLIIDDLLLRAPGENYGVGYIYFDYIEKHQQRPIRVFASLVKQLASQTRFLPTEVVKLHKKLWEDQKRPTLKDLYGLLIATSKEFSRVFLVFDALDECDEREELLLLFHRLSKNGISVFLTSRPHPYDIQESFCNVANIGLLAKEEDVSTYIQQRIEKNMRARGLAGKYRDQVVSELAGCAQGMFLLVRFHVEHICGQTTVRQVLRELEKLKMTSTNSEKGPLDPTYDRAMNSILKQTENSANLALTILSWLIKAKRTLTIDELRQAVSIEPNPSEYELDELNIPDTATLLDVCCGLIVIDENTKTVRLAHYTVHEYLLRNSMFSDAEFKIATACATYLSFDVFAEGPCKYEIPYHREPLSSWNGRFEAYPFLRYAARHLTDHLKVCDFTSTTAVFLRLLGNQGNIDSYQQAFEFDDFTWFDHTPGRTPLNLASAIGHYPVVQHLLKNGVDCSVSDHAGMKALQKAASEGHDQVVQLLLQEGADPLAADDNGWTALSKAAAGGHKTVVQLLLKHGADFSPPENHQHWQNALNLAAFRGHTGVVKLLLENGSGTTIRNQGTHGWASLYYAAMKGHKETVQLLLEHSDGKDISALNKNGETALHQAAHEGHNDIVKLLLQNGANVSISDENRLGETPIHRAASRGHEQAVQLLLEHGADILALDKRGSTALHKAASGGHTRVVELLLENCGNTVQVQDSKGRTALQIALFEGYGKIVQLIILQSGLLTDILAQDTEGVTELHRAADSGYKDVICVLLENGADISVQDNKGWTALHNAASRGHSDVVQLLLENGADISVLDSSGSTALLMAVESRRGTVAVHRECGVEMSLYCESRLQKALHKVANGQKEVFRLLVEGDAALPPVPFTTAEFVHRPKAGRCKDVCQLLLEHGADSSIRNKLGQSLLHLAAYSGQVEVVQLLLENGADMFDRDHEGQTALHTAAMAPKDYRSIDVIQLLLENRADISALNNSGQTALHLTASDGWKGWHAADQLLLAAGVDLSVQDNSGRTALHWAACNMGESVELFIGMGADLSMLDNSGQTALHLAASKGRAGAAEILLKNGADTSVRDNSGRTALHWAADNGDQYTVQAILKNGPDISARDNSGKTALHLTAFRSWEKDTPRLLLENGADILAQDNSGQTPLHLAAFEGSKMHLLIFLDAGADVNVLDRNGQTALHLAASRGLKEIVQILLENGADISIEDNSGLTALHVAAAANEVYEEVLHLLFDSRIDTDVLIKGDQKTYYNSEHSEPPETVQLLLDKGADPSIMNNYRRPAMDRTLPEPPVQLPGGYVFERRLSYDDRSLGHVVRWWQ